ncbi:glycosyltransferase [Synechococcus sp. PCC 7502]|uniref:glycosyltransferase family 4 protein n=1 Tax=Synechococcus sp. PCC 7502 TaxID=1173263 RepID=UPI00029FC036|nr:glycosyltransferase family 4 protein [Synechococcus sp. PCC 7502]AFY74463.1 glycosyltransferase [Synechococcus sp. PCC 7502]
MIRGSKTWICCQIGAREHYSIPRALQQDGKLACLITDAWVTPSSPLNILAPSGLKERFHKDLAQVPVYAFNNSLISFEIAQKLRKCIGWEQTIARNHWFQKEAIKKLTQLAKQFTTPPILFSYSYAALELFKFARQQGWTTVLGQIDPGIEEERIVTQEYESHPQYRGNWQPAPAKYWQDWQEECSLANVIIVNSHWSRQLLEKAGIESQKIQIVPLIYTPPEEVNNFSRTYPESFTQERPLRVLFLGQVILRKGIASVLSSIKLLTGLPIEFWIIGSQQIEIPPYFKTHLQIRWVGHINRSETAQYYQLADIFLFPTLSDGFGLTQLEAQAWKLPIVASRYCGDVVLDGVNGWLLNEVSAEAIADQLKSILQSPQCLNEFSNKLVPRTLVQDVPNYKPSDLSSLLESMVNSYN